MNLAAERLLIIKLVKVFEIAESLCSVAVTKRCESSTYSRCHRASAAVIFHQLRGTQTKLTLTYLSSGPSCMCMTLLTALFPKSLGGSSALFFEPPGVIAFERKPIANDLYASRRKRHTSTFLESVAATNKGLAIPRTIDRIKGRSNLISDQVLG